MMKYQDYINIFFGSCTSKLHGKNVGINVRCAHVLERIALKMCHLKRKLKKLSGKTPLGELG